MRTVMMPDGHFEVTACVDREAIDGLHAFAAQQAAARGVGIEVDDQAIALALKYFLPRSAEPETAAPAATKATGTSAARTALRTAYKALPDKDRVRPTRQLARELAPRVGLADSTARKYLMEDFPRQPCQGVSAGVRGG